MIRASFEQIVGKRISYSLSVLKLGIELGGDVYGCYHLSNPGEVKLL